MVIKKNTNKSYELTIGWMYPELMSTYGDRGNITVLRRRCEWRNILVNILRISSETKPEEIKKVDIFFGGGAQDREQEIVMRDLMGEKGKIIKKMILNNTPALFVCGSPQLMGNFYEPAKGKRIEGLGVFDMHTVHPGKNKQRLIGNVVAEIYWENFQYNESPHPSLSKGGSKLEDLNGNKFIVGFENHGGRTFLGSSAKPFAKVIKGSGNNGKDGSEGVIFKNAIGTYLHGPLLPKNPEIADHLISKALEVKYGQKVNLEPLDDELEMKAKEIMIKRVVL